MNEEPVRLSLFRNTKRLTIVSPDGEQEWECEMRALTGRERNYYLTSVQDRMKLGPDRKPIGFKSYDGMHSSLLVMCLFKIVDGKRVPFTVEEIEEWPAEPQEQLFEMAQRLSGLNKKGVEEAGNE